MDKLHQEIHTKPNIPRKQSQRAPKPSGKKKVIAEPINNNTILTEKNGKIDKKPISIKNKKSKENLETFLSTNYQTKEKKIEEKVKNVANLVKNQLNEKEPTRGFEFRRENDEFYAQQLLDLSSSSLGNSPIVSPIQRTKSQTFSSETSDTSCMSASELSPPTKRRHLNSEFSAEDNFLFKNRMRMVEAWCQNNCRKRTLYAEIEEDSLSTHWNNNELCNNHNTNEAKKNGNNPVASSSFNMLQVPIIKKPEISAKSAMNSFGGTIKHSFNNNMAKVPESSLPNYLPEKVSNDLNNNPCKNNNPLQFGIFYNNANKNCMDDNNEDIRIYHPNNMMNLDYFERNDLDEILTSSTFGKEVERSDNSDNMDLLEEDNTRIDFIDSNNENNFIENLPDLQQMGYGLLTSMEANVLSTFSNAPNYVTRSMLVAENVLENNCNNNFNDVPMDMDQIKKNENE